MKEFIYDIDDVARELIARGEKVRTRATIINKIKKLQLYRKGKAIKTPNGFTTPGGQKGSKWLLTEEGMNDLIDELIKRGHIPGVELSAGEGLKEQITITPEIREPEKNKKGRLRKTDHNSYLIEVDADLVNKFQDKGYKWKEDISFLVNTLLEEQYHVYEAIEKKEREIQEAYNRIENLQIELEMMNKKIGV